MTERSERATTDLGAADEPSGTWFLAGCAGLAGFFALEAALREPGQASSIAASSDDRGTTRGIVRAFGPRGDPDADPEPPSRAAFASRCRTGRPCDAGLRAVTPSVVDAHPARLVFADPRHTRPAAGGRHRALPPDPPPGLPDRSSPGSDSR